MQLRNSAEVLTLKTLDDARSMMLELPERRALQHARQSAVQKVMSAAQSGGRQDIEEATKQLELALSLDAKLVLR